MKSKDIMGSIKSFLNRLDDDISEIYEETYRSRVVIDTLISLLIKKGVFSKEELKEQTARIRERIRCRKD